MRDPKPNSVFDAECITCHTTGFEFVSGWKSPTETPYLAGNQCENCHGPASRHVAEPDNTEFRKPMHLTAELAEKSRLCYGCHDEDNSRDFEFSKYYGKIVHKGRDTYTDPKVHKGIAPVPKRPSRCQPTPRNERPSARGEQRGKGRSGNIEKEVPKRQHRGSRGIIQGESETWTSPIGVKRRIIVYGLLTRLA